VGVPLHETAEATHAGGRRSGLAVKRRLAALALVTGGLALLATLDTAIAVGPAFAVSLAAARLVAL
jgi:hypothetical protein